MTSSSDLSKPGTNQEVDVAVLTVIPAELFAALDALGIPATVRERNGDGTVYYRGTIRSKLAGRDYRVVVTCIGAAGNPSATAATRDVITVYRPSAVLLMGIAAGIRGKVRIGEVVLSERVVAYEPAAVSRSPDGGSLEQPRPEIDRTPHAIQQDVTNYRFKAERAGAIFRKAGCVFPVPPDGAPEDEARAFRQHVARVLSVRTSTIASGEKLLRDPAKLLDVRAKLHGKTEAGEMEAVGVVEACRRGAVPWLVVRGISDFGDELKDDRFHDFAARAAAAVLTDFLVHGLDLGSVPSSRHGLAYAIGLAALGGLFVIGASSVHGYIRARPTSDTPPGVETSPSVAPASSDPSACRKPELEWVPEYPRCGEQLMVATKGSCVYPKEARIGHTGKPHIVELRALCAMLSGSAAGQPWLPAGSGPDK